MNQQILNYGTAVLLKYQLYSDKLKVLS